MWKRLNTAKSSNGATRQFSIGEPVLAKTNIFEKSYGAAGGIDNMLPSDRNNAPPSRPTRGNIAKRLPLLPFDIVPPMQHSQPNPDNVEPVSSHHPQPSLGPMDHQFPYNTYAKPLAPKSAEISPPSSPEFDGTQRTQNRYQGHEVSPIDEVPDISHLGFGKYRERADSSLKIPSSNIPVVRREKRRNQVAAVAANILRKDVDGLKVMKTADIKWDPYPGEQTTSERGKLQSVKAGEYSSSRLGDVMQFGNTSIISAGAQKTQNQMSFGERVRKLKNNAPIEKPEWKGATGRTKIVPTPSDNYNTPPLRMPIAPRGEERITSGTSTPASSIRSSNSETQATPIYMDPPKPLPINAQHSLSGRNSPQSYNELSIQMPEPIHAPRLPNFPMDISIESPSKYHPSHSKKDSTGTIERNFRDALKNSFPPIDPNEPYVEPPSRFSVSTKATSEYTQSTRAPSLDLQNDNYPPLPVQSHTMSTQGPTSILSRQRPKFVPDDAASIYSNKSITRKAINSGDPITISITSSLPREKPHPQRSSSSALTKSLPNTPAETASLDPISTLQARLETLARRRQNIERSIKQMTELMPTDRMIITEEVRRKREGEKKQIEELRKQEAEIRREEHECGMKLHRAWKRKDNQAGYEGTGLWVRRVTG
ncbi:hypothetical protein DSL72_003326 [Monilinia vaccinii-corymbosi]|uniref:Uncharacterized protein n=1 Tax=Monilinia vaccinii-corymbosi TaxID=61207 RepID=A0A8A3P202_9HELO|nr:hypothetical protein DSL72_003326 [Monilinia vaccinii-corymbosi]